MVSVRPSGLIQGASFTSRFLLLWLVFVVGTLTNGSESSNGNIFSIKGKLHNSVKQDACKLCKACSELVL